MNLEELKKNHQTSYLAGVLERLEKEESEINKMLASDESLREMAESELKNIQIQKEQTEKQIQDILDKEKEAEEFKEKGVDGKAEQKVEAPSFATHLPKKK